MRTIRRTSVLAIVLATAPVVFANAQSATQPPASPAVTRQDLQQVQDRQNHQARQIQKMRNEVNGVKAVQGEQRNSITTLETRTETLETNATQTGSTVKSLNQSVKAAQTNASTMRKWIIAVGIIALFCGIALIVNLVRLRHIAQDALTREEIEGMIAKQTTPIVKEVIVREKVYVNSSQPELRSAWRTLRSVAPTGPVSLLYALRFEKDLEKGRDMEGLVEGYTVEFDDTKPIDGQVPKFFYRGKRVAYDNLTQHGLDILRTEQTISNVSSISSGPIRLFSRTQKGPGDTTLLHRAIDSTTASRRIIG